MTILRKLKIKSRLIISLIVTSLIPLIIIGGYSSFKASEGVTSKIQNYTVQIMHELNKNITTFLSSYERLSDEIMLSEPLQKSLKKINSLTVTQKFEMKNQIEEYINKNYLLLADINSVEIYTKDRQSFYSLGYHNELIDWDKLIEKADYAGGAIVWSSLYFKGTNSIAMTRRINNDDMSLGGIGFLIIILKESAIRQLYNNIDLGNDSTIFILSDKGRVVSSDGKEDIEFNDNWSGLLSDIKLGKKLNILKDDKCLYVYSYLDKFRWYSIARIPYSYINHEVNQINKRIIYLSLIVIVICIFLSIIITLSITSPLSKLVHLMDLIKQGILNIPDTVEADDEISYLEKHFHSMRLQIIKLIQKVRIEQEEKRKADITALQAQINPHFLFNTLNSLKWVASINQSTTIENGLESLSLLLRNTIINTDEEVTLKEEIDNIYHYVNIQKIRYGETFTIINNVDKELEGCSILKFILQPMVENCILHGVSNEIDNMSITLSTKKIGQDIEIIIEDNGKGFDMKEIDEINQKSKLSGIGIDNVRERIRLSYGKEYGIEIFSCINKGTRVTLKIPYKNLN